MSIFITAEGGAEPGLAARTTRSGPASLALLEELTSTAAIVTRDGS